MTANTQNSLLEQQAHLLVEHLRAMGPLAVAFSGGVDSSVVARAAFEALGDLAVAVTAVSPSLAARELTIARQVAQAIGIRHVELSTGEFERPEYRRNSGDRCYFCKQTLYRMTQQQLARLQVNCLVNGANTDDRNDYRPGMRAAAEFEVRSPLIELGFNKSAVRDLARLWCLPVADKPASPCLASRIAYGVEVTVERVARTEAAEALIQDLTGITELRVRTEAGELARIEVPLSQLPVLTQPSVSEEITRALRSLGYQRVTLDLEGFRSGSLNALLPVLETEGNPG